MTLLGSPEVRDRVRRWAVVAIEETCPNTPQECQRATDHPWDRMLSYLVNIRPEPPRYCQSVWNRQVQRQRVIETALAVSLQATERWRTIPVRGKGG